MNHGKSIYLVLCYQITTEIHEIDTNINHIKWKKNLKIRRVKKNYPSVVSNWQMVDLNLRSLILKQKFFTIEL